MWPVRVRAYLEDATDASWILPRWFEFVLGSGTPRKNREAWLRTAIDVIYYRIVYNVAHKIEALGDRPTNEDHAPTMTGSLPP